MLPAQEAARKGLRWRDIPLADAEEQGRSTDWHSGRRPRAPATPLQMATLAAVVLAILYVLVYATGTGNRWPESPTDLPTQPPEPEDEGEIDPPSMPALPSPVEPAGPEPLRLVHLGDITARYEKLPRSLELNIVQVANGQIWAEHEPEPLTSRLDLVRDLEQFLVEDPGLLCLCPLMFNTSLPIRWIAIRPWNQKTIHHLVNPRVRDTTLDRSEALETSPLLPGAEPVLVERYENIRVGYSHAVSGADSVLDVTGGDAHCIQSTLELLAGQPPAQARRAP